MSVENPQVEHTQTLSTGNENFEHLKDLTTLVYVLQAIAFIGLTPVIGIIINYIKKSDVQGTILASHFRWQMRTFWFGLLWFCIAVVLNYTVIGAVLGVPLLVIVGIWWIYRFIRGWLTLSNNKPMYASS